MKSTSSLIRNTFMMFLIIIIACIGTVSCKKNTVGNCVHCTAVCTGTSSTNLDYCGDDWQQQETSFKASHDGCTINCDR